MCCGIYTVLVNGKLAKNATMDPVLYFWYYNQKTITSIAVLAQTRLSWHRHINAFFGLKTGVNQKA